MTYRRFIPRLSVSMRLGNSRSKSYRNFKSRQYVRRNKVVDRLCYRLDRLVERAESFRKGTATRTNLLKMADNVREKLREIDH